MVNSNYTFYVPKEEEPSVFTEVPDRVNTDWVQWGLKYILGMNIVKGTKHFDALQELMDEKIVMVGPGHFVRKPDPDSIRISLGERHLLSIGKTVQQKVAIDLGNPFDTPPFPAPSRILTSENYISFRWVLHIAREDGMTPNEAYAYAQALTKGK